MNPTHDRRIEELLETVVDLHTLPVIILEAERLMRDPRTSAQQVADLLGRDPALAGRILRLVNSPFYGFQRRIGNLTQAIVILGFQTVKNLMLTVSVIESFHDKNEGAFDYPRFWAHSVATAIAAAEIARLARTPLSDEAYIGGLLHDAGKLMIAQHLPELSEAVTHEVREGRDECEAEQAILGIDHTEVGARLATAWSFPPTLVDAIRDHHSPRRDGDSASPADVIQLADLLTHSLGLAFEPWVLPPICEGLSQRLGYDEAVLSEWITRIVDQLAQANEFFEVVGAGCLQPLVSWARPPPNPPTHSPSRRESRPGRSFVFSSGPCPGSGAWCRPSFACGVRVPGKAACSWRRPGANRQPARPTSTPMS